MRYDPGSAAFIQATITGYLVGGDARGAAVDSRGNVWTSNRQTSNVSRLHIDATSGEPAPHPTTGDTVDVFPAGPTPNVHSDFTGMAYRRVTRPDGDYHVLLPTCAGAQTALWLGVEWNATTPVGTRVELYARTG